MEEKNKGGRPTKYNPDMNEVVTNYCLLGATDEDLARFLDVDIATIYRWKNDHEEFCEAIKMGKDIADGKVAKSLYDRALGYSHPDTDIRVLNGEIVKTEVIKHYPPDATSAIFWLKNRQPERWREKQIIDNQSTDGSMSPSKAVFTDDQVKIAVEALKDKV